MKAEKIIPTMLGIVLILLIFEFIYAIYHSFNYQERVDFGNARWQQVEDRLIDMEEKIEELEGECGCGRNI